MRLRLPAALTAALVLATTLGGCFLLPTEQQQPSQSSSATADDEEAAEAQPAAAPEVGDCWTTLDSNWGDWEVWHGDAAVDCAEDHESYTFAVPTAFEELETIYQSGTWLTEEAAVIAVDLCYGALDRFMKGHLDDWTRMEAQYFAPSKQEWKDGARWVRCDLVVLELGSSIYERKMAELPEDASELVEAYAEHPDHFNICLDTDEGFTGYGPLFSENSYYSDCSVDPMWRLDSWETYPADYGVAYPGDEAMAAFATEGCLADMSPQQWGYAHFPDATTWVSGDRSFTCWSYEWEVPENAAPPV